MSSMSGTVIISVMFQAIALLLCAIEYLRRKPLSKLLGCAQPTDADVLEDDYVKDDYADAVVTINKKGKTTVSESHGRLHANLAKIQAMQQSMETNQASFKKDQEGSPCYLRNLVKRRLQAILSLWGQIILKRPSLTACRAAKAWTLRMKACGVNLRCGRSSVFTL